MQTSEACVLLKTIRKNYPGAHFLENATPQFILDTSESWAKTLTGIQLDEAIYAVRVHSMKSPYAPTISDITSIVARMRNPSLNLTGEELWSKVLEAVRRYGRWNKAKALETLPEEARPYVSRWFSQICDAGPDIIRGPFIKGWDAELVRLRERTILSEKAQRLLGLSSPLSLNAALDAPAQLMA